MGKLFNQIINTNQLGKTINNIIDKENLYTIESKIESLMENIEQKKKLYKRERSKLNIYTHPITITKYFIFYLYDIFKLLISYIISNIIIITISSILIVFCIYIINENTDPNTLNTIKYSTLWYGYWLILGVLSSIGLGTGLHTFLLFLGPHIAEVTTAAYTCGNLNFSVFGEGSFVCKSNTVLSSMNILSIFSKVKMQSFFWGLGTAIGELPPYFVSKAAALTGEKNQNISDIENGDKSKKGFVDRIQNIIFKFLKKFGFIGILLCASIPNPLFDVAGILCGHFMIPFTTFFGATFIGKAIIKNTVQSIFIIVIFSETVIKYLLSLLQGYPTLYNFAKEALNEQTRKFKGDFDESVEEDSGIISLIWNSIIFIMIGYFIASIIESLSISQFNKVKEKELNEMVKDSENNLDIQGPDEKVIKELTSAVYKYIKSYISKSSISSSSTEKQKEKKKTIQSKNNKNEGKNQSENILKKKNSNFSIDNLKNNKKKNENSIIDEIHSKDKSDMDASYFIISKLQ